MVWHLVGNVLDKVFDYMLGAKSWDNVNLNLKASLDEASPLFEAYIDYVMEKKENKVADEASVPFLTDTVVYELASEDSVSLVERVSFDAEDDNEANEDMAIDTLRDESLTNLWSRGSGLSEVVVLVNGMLHEGGQVVVCGLQGPMITRIQSLLTPHRHPMNEIQVKGLEHSIAGKESAMEDTRSVMSKRDAVSKKEESKRDAAGFGFDLLGSGLSYISSCFCTTGFVAFLLLFEYLVLFSSELFLSSTPFFHRLLPSACAFDDGHNSMGLQSIALVLALVMFLQRVE
ncbi:uncharacterized protein [Euphorbia lathyris]|uniref:uncharacterized protein n=1 Tax=Euphorbia lathyris TaxID=212925 RepID=UPI003313AF31